ncbi:MAG: metal-dependent hydrolase [Acidimicrobiales bacterium]|nr:metal-dependent hydrolase [Acidimicrobiales bacterium]
MPAFTLASFNTRWGLGLDDRPVELRDTCAGFDTDLIALQEVWEPSDGSGRVGPIAAELGYAVHAATLSPSAVDPRPRITADPDDAEGGWGIALLSRLPVRSVRTLDLGRLFERKDVASRLAVMADVDVEGTTVTVVVVHLSFVLANAAAQLRRLRGALPADRPSVVAGDCNLWGPVAITALGGWRRAVRGRTWPASRPHSQLDHVLVSKQVDVLASRVGPPAGSDHLPVQVELAVPASAQPPAGG